MGWTSAITDEGAVQPEMFSKKGVYTFCEQVDMNPKFEARGLNPGQYIRTIIKQIGFEKA